MSFCDRQSSFILIEISQTIHPKQAYIYIIFRQSEEYKDANLNFSWYLCISRLYFTGSCCLTLYPSTPICFKKCDENLRVSGDTPDYRGSPQKFMFCGVVNAFVVSQRRCLLVYRIGFSLCLHFHNPKRRNCNFLQRCENRHPVLSLFSGSNR